MHGHLESSYGGNPAIPDEDSGGTGRPPKENKPDE